MHKRQRKKTQKRWYLKNHEVWPCAFKRVALSNVNGIVRVLFQVFHVYIIMFGCVFFIPSFVLNFEQTASVLNFAIQSLKIEAWCAWSNTKLQHLINGKSHTTHWAIQRKMNRTGLQWLDQITTVENWLEKWLLIPEIYDDQRFLP